MAFFKSSENIGTLSKTYLDMNGSLKLATREHVPLVKSSPQLTVHHRPLHLLTYLSVITGMDLAPSVISLLCAKKLFFSDLGFTHVLKQFSNCKRKMCVYLLTCRCGLRYVGSTRHQLKVCIQEHVSRIRNTVLEVPLVQHFIDTLQQICHVWSWRF